MRGHNQDIHKNSRNLQGQDGEQVKARGGRDGEEKKEEIRMKARRQGGGYNGRCEKEANSGNCNDIAATTATLTYLYVTFKYMQFY
jgi:hypothetical protein